MRDPRVLVAEDDEAVRLLLADYLRSRMRARVDMAADGVEALHLLASANYDVIVLDVMMPKLSGADLLDSLQALTSDPSVKRLDRAPAVIIITSTPHSLLPDEAISHRLPASVRGVFRKPLRIDEIGRCVERQLGGGRS